MNKGFAPIIILVILSLAIGGYFAYQADYLKTTIIPPTVTTSQIGHWKTYTSNNLGVSFRYPENLFIDEHETRSFIAAGEEEFKLPFPDDGIHVPFAIQKGEEVKSLGGHFSTGDFTKETEKRMELTVDGEPALMYSGNWTTPFGRDDYHSKVMLLRNGRIYIISHLFISKTITKEVFDQILSTFQFTD